VSHRRGGQDLVFYRQHGPFKNCHFFDNFPTCFCRRLVCIAGCAAGWYVRTVLLSCFRSTICRDSPLGSNDFVFHHIKVCPGAFSVAEHGQGLSNHLPRSIILLLLLIIIIMPW
jgi:hypothetical protein